MGSALCFSPVVAGLLTAVALAQTVTPGSALPAQAKPGAPFEAPGANSMDYTRGRDMRDLRDNQRFPVADPAPRAIVPPLQPPSPPVAPPVYPSRADDYLPQNIDARNLDLRDDAVNPSAERWRYVRQSNTWWYYTPENRWLVYVDNGWIPYDPAKYRGVYTAQSDYPAAMYPGRYSSAYRGPVYYNQGGSYYRRGVFGRQVWVPYADRGAYNPGPYSPAKSNTVQPPPPPPGIR